MLIAPSGPELARKGRGGTRQAPTARRAGAGLGHPRMQTEVWGGTGLYLVQKAAGREKLGGGEYYRVPEEKDTESETTVCAQGV